MQAFRTSLAALAATLGMPALAQSQTAPAMPTDGQAPSAAPGAGSNAGSAIAEIVVTARRREESLQSVPLAVQAFTGNVLEQNRIENGTDLSKIVPALTASESSRNEENYVIRGQSGSGASISGQQVTVPAYFSQVPLPIGDGGGPGRYYDLQNVQVLKGPQGTLFGRNSTGGAVLFEPQRPTDHFDGYIEGQLGNYADHAINGAINLPVSDTFKIRLAGNAEQRDGFTHDITTGQYQDDRRYAGGRVSLLWQPSSSIEDIFVADIYHSHTNGGSNHLTAINPNASIIKLYGTQIPTLLAEQEALGPYVAISSVPNVDKLLSWGFSNITTIHLGDAITFKNIVGYRRVQQLNRFDYDGTPLTLLDFDSCSMATTCHTMSPGHPLTLDVSQWSEEPQIQGKIFDGHLNYTVGLFGSNSNSPNSNYLHQTSVLGSTTDVNSFINDTSRAVYGQFNYSFGGFLRGLTLTGGYRRTTDHRGLTTYQVASGKCQTGTIGAVVTNPADAPQCGAHFQANYSTNSYIVGLDYKVTDAIMVYVTHRQGYRAGGTNPLVAPALQATPAIPNAQGLFTYAPETLRDVEIGLKSEFNVSDWKIRANIALYKDWLDNAQINQTFTVGTQTVSALTNAASANIKGVEAEITVAPSRHFNVLFAYAYTNAKYGSFVDYTHRDPVTGAPGLSTGRIFPFTPHHKLNIAPTLTLPTPSDWGELTLNANYAFKSSIILGLVPFITLPSGANMFDGESRQKATNTVDLNVQWAHIFGSRFDASFFITNVTNTVYKIGGASLINSGLGINQRIYNEPRMFGGTIRVHFGDHS